MCMYGGGGGGVSGCACVRVCTHKQTHCTSLEHVYSTLHFLSLDQWEESKEDTIKTDHHDSELLRYHRKPRLMCTILGHTLNLVMAPLIPVVS